MQQVYLNGKFIDAAEAMISVMDRGFLFADSVYEVIPVFDGHAFAAKAHLDRLNQSLDGIQMPPVMSHSEWLAILERLLPPAQQLSCCHMFYLQVTRGAYSKRSHDIPEQCIPTVFAYCQEIAPKDYANSNGYHAITLPDTRRRDCWIKSTSLLPNVLLNDIAKKANAVEAILIRDGLAQEGTTSNLFIVKEQTIITPPIMPTLLAGITRQAVLEIAQRLNMPYCEQVIPESELVNADEIWMTGSVKEICPITTLNNQPVGQGKPGQIWQTIFTAYEETKRHG